MLFILSIVDIVADSASRIKIKRKSARRHSIHQKGQ